MSTLNRFQLTVSLVAVLMLSACHPEASDGHGGSGEPAPRVTVASPVQAQVTDTEDYVASTESPQRVEIRPRVSGAIVRTAFVEGQLVKKGALLFVIDPRPFEVSLAHAEAELASVKADHGLALKNAARADRLFKASVIAQREYDQRTSETEQLSARVQVAEAAVAAAKLELEYAYIRSPISGRVGRKLVTEGNQVGPSTASALTTVLSVDPLYVYFDVEESLALGIPRDEPLTARISFGTDTDFSTEAKVDFLDNHVEPGSGTMKFRAVVPNPQGRLTDGLYARVRLPMGKAKPALLVADQAIATDQDRRFVWVVDGNSKVEYRQIKLGPLRDGLRVVREGLHDGDKVIVRGLKRSQAGVTVTTEVISMHDLDRETEKRAER
jgi:RND family efflux transporter MFP subunit